jgi:hypothetical protein
MKSEKERVPKRGLEPPQGWPYQDLNLARLPIPPLRQSEGGAFYTTKGRNRIAFL